MKLTGFKLGIGKRRSILEIKQKSQMCPLTLPLPGLSAPIGLWSLSPLPPRRQLILVKLAVVVARREVYLFLFIIGSFLNPVEP